MQKPHVLSAALLAFAACQAAPPADPEPLPEIRYYMIADT